MIPAMRKLILSTLLAGMACSLQAQDNLYVLEYSVAIPTGDLRAYIDDPSFRGFNFGFRNMVDVDRAVGFDLGWQTFFERMDRATYTDGTSSLTGVQYRYTNAFNASLQVDHVFGDGHAVRPFVGLGLGTMYVRRSLDMGLYRIERDPWQFLLQPEAGVSFYLANGGALLLSANYYWGFKTKQLDGQRYVSIGLAYAFNP